MPTTILIISSARKNHGRKYSSQRDTSRYPYLFSFNVLCNYHSNPFVNVIMNSHIQQRHIYPIVVVCEHNIYLNGYSYPHPKRFQAGMDPIDL
mgnify:CR=1 FL=1